MTFINEIESNESQEHKDAKVKLFEKLSKNRMTFINQFGKEINVTPNRTWTNLYMEAYVYKYQEKCDPYKGSLCACCFYETEEFINRINRDKDHIYEESISHCIDNRFEQNELNTILNSNNTFTQHPCSICKYKSKLDIIAIFDIAGSLDENYTIAIEVVKTSHCSENKIKFCNDNNLILLEINYQDILNLKDEELSLPCIAMWWVERDFNGKYRKRLYTF